MGVRLGRGSSPTVASSAEIADTQVYGTMLPLTLTVALLANLASSVALAVLF